MSLYAMVNLAQEINTSGHVINNGELNGLNSVRGGDVRLPERVVCR